MPIVWSDRRVTERPASGSDLATVLRRLAVDARFAAAVVEDPATALARYQLSGNDLSALALWLDQPVGGDGIDSLFNGDRDRPT